MRERTSTRTRVVAVAVASAVLMTGCASSSGSDEGGGDADASRMDQDEIYVDGIVGDQEEVEPVDGGTLTIADYAEARTLDPTSTIPNGATGGNALAAIYDTLMRYDQESDSFEPHLAESLESDDDTTWTLTLREGVTFSDGTPLDARAVVGSLGYYMENFGFHTLVLASSIEDMRPVDERTVEFTLNRPFPTFPSLLAGGPGMVLAPAAIKGGKDNFEPIGAGPFTFEDYQPSEELVLARNEDYWDGAPHLEQLRFVWLGADDAKLEALEGGSVDVANIRFAGTVEEARRDGWAGAMAPKGLGSQLWINNREDRAGSDPRLREAMVLAIDPEQYLERAAEGAGIATRSIYHPSMPYYEDIETPEQDPERAQQLVEEAKADGANTSLTYIGQSDQASQNAAVTLEAQLEAVGFDVELELLNDVTEQTRRIYQTFDYDLAVSSMSLGRHPFSNLYTGLMSESPQNPSGYGAQEMDQLIMELQGAEGDEVADVLTRINEQWQEDLPGVALAAGAFFRPWQDEVHGVQTSFDDLLLFDEAFKAQE